LHLKKMSSNQEQTELAALGRPFCLGMLYDIRREKLITGLTLWDSQKLKQNIVQKKQAFSDFDVITEDNLQTKTRVLGVDGSLKLGIITGLINLSGSAKFAKNRQETNHQTRLTLKYSLTTHFEQLAMDHLGKDNLDHSQILDGNVATHVVTGILYGADAYFVFDHSSSSEENKRDIGGAISSSSPQKKQEIKGTSTTSSENKNQETDGTILTPSEDKKQDTEAKLSISSIDKKKETVGEILEAVLKRVGGCGFGGEAKINLNDTEKKCIDKLNCKFHGDFRLDQNPSTFKEAIELYQKLPS
ncbi:unnamed protein product, partial [Didymodactylos carnosus]